MEISDRHWKFPTEFRQTVIANFRQRVFRQEALKFNFALEVTPNRRFIAPICVFGRKFFDKKKIFHQYSNTNNLHDRYVRFMLMLSIVFWLGKERAFSAVINHPHTHLNTHSVRFCRQSLENQRSMA